jgi:hypothetical protein
LLDALDEAFAMPYAGFDFRRKTPIEPIRETDSHRFEVQVSFRGKSWETIQVEVVTERPTDGRVNLRYWDLIDLILLRPLVQDPAALRAACVEVFDVRGTHTWPPSLDVVERWRDPYRADVARLGAAVPTDLDEGIEAVRRFIAEIDRAG